MSVKWQHKRLDGSQKVTLQQISASQSQHEMPGNPLDGYFRPSADPF